MTYRSESRGFMYSSPPTGERNDEQTRPENEQADPEPAVETPEIDPEPQTTDANWTGTVPADD